METIFHFKFDNPFGFLLPFVPAIINLALVVYVYFFFVRNRVTTVFSLLTLSLACWQLNSATGRIAFDEKTAAAWETFFLVPWSMVGPLCLHFALLYSQIIDERKWRPWLISAYLITLFFIGIYNSGLYEHHFVYFGFWGWVDEHKDNIIDVISISWLTFLSLISIFILIVHTFRMRRDGAFFYQSLLIAFGITTPALIGIIAQFILPIIFQVDSVPVTSVAMSIFSISTVIALSKYNLFRAADIYNLENLLDRIPSYIICINEDERINYINEFTCNKLKLSKKQLSNVDISKALQFPNTALYKKFSAALKSSLNGFDTLNLETSLIINEEVIHTLMSIRPIFIESKIHGAIINIRDITEIYKSHERIERSEAQLKVAQKIGKMGSWEWDILKNEITWSEEIYRIYGIEFDGKRKTYDEFLNTIEESDRSNINSIIQQSFISKQPFTYTRKTKNNKSIQSNGYVEVNADGQVIKMNGTVQDVTTIVEKENKLTFQNEELHKINSELDRFVYSVSHDLRSPLTSIEGLINIALDETNEPAMKDYLGMIQTSTLKLDSFIQEILHYSRNARMDLHLDTIDIQNFVNEIIDHHQFPNQKKVFINVNIQAPFPFISDKTRIQLILNNLVSNAIRYSNPNNEKSFVDIVINVDEHNAILKIIDNGLGIAEKIKPRIFEMFFRGHKESVGSGLGLYIVKEAVEKLKGKISLQSKLGEGSTFIVEIPNHKSNKLF